MAKLKFKVETTYIRTENDAYAGHVTVSAGTEVDETNVANPQLHIDNGSATRVAGTAAKPAKGE